MQLFSKNYQNQKEGKWIRVISFAFWIAQIPNFELVSSVLALEATEPVSEPVNQMAVESLNNHLILVQQKRWM